MANPPRAQHSRSNAFLIAGVVGILGGGVLLYFGLSPVVPLMNELSGVFGGGEPPADLQERMDATIAELKSRAAADVFGFIALIAGFVCVKIAFAKPKPKTVDQLVAEEVERRMAHVAPGAPVAPIPSTAPAAASFAPSAPQPSLATPEVLHAPPAASAHGPPSSPPAARRTHCACGSVLVAGGRICPAGHPQV